MHAADKITFDEDSRPVASVGFVYPDEHAEEVRPRTDPLETLRHGLLVIIGDGHADGARVRAVALARLLELYATDADAAAAAQVNRRTIHRAIARMKNKIQGSLCPKNLASKAA